MPTPQARLERAAGSPDADGNVIVLAGDFRDCGGSCEPSRPGEPLTMKAEDVRAVLAPVVPEPAPEPVPTLKQQALPKTPPKSGGKTTKTTEEES